MTGSASTQQSTKAAALRERLQQRAVRATPDDWLAVVIAAAEIGIASPDIASFLASAMRRFVLTDYRLVLDDDGMSVGQRSELLAEASQRLRDEGLLAGWRNELLDVRTSLATPAVAVIERAACRALGLPTFAVHLNAFTADGALMVAQRAADKAVDPGRWDNLVGGMMPAGESEMDALRREAHEEAGLDLALLPVQRIGEIPIARPIPEGWMVETISAYTTTLPAAIDLANQDGEVAQIRARSIDDVLEAIERDEFTLEAALVTVEALRHTA